MSSKPKPDKKTHVDAISIAGQKALTGPISMHQYAEHYVAALKELGDPDVPYEPVRYHLAGHAIELCLKAFLSMKGLTHQQLQEHGHHLAKMLDSAQQMNLNDLVQLSQDHEQQIRLAAEYFNEKVFAYPAMGEALSGYPKLPDRKLLSDAAQLLVESLRESCREFQ